MSFELTLTLILFGVVALLVIYVFYIKPSSDSKLNLQYPDIAPYDQHNYLIYLIIGIIILIGAIKFKIIKW